MESRVNGGVNGAPPTAPPLPATMPVPRCDRCAFWKLSMIPERGPCAMSMRTDGGLSVYMPTTQLGQVWTRADFGCVQFKARP